MPIDLRSCNRSMLGLEILAGDKEGRYVRICGDAARTLDLEGEVLGSTRDV